MPLEKLESQHKQHIWGIWKVTEEESSLMQLINTVESIPETITHPQKRMEFAAGRVLSKLLLEKMGGIFSGITKDEFGKPFFKNHSIHLSLSHSYPYVAAIADTDKTVGIDIEQPKSKLLRIASRILHETELKDAGDNEIKHCVYWCAKEAMIKVYGKKDLTLASQLLVAPFTLAGSGMLSGKIITVTGETTVPLYYSVFDDFVVTLSM